ncbi:hypothetical protein [Streptomyces sp. NPDC046805]|uniref:hypothetical protein n=1 Tax=Streptomyces sp. NPDC046805 TaxID=3155134 RepID=UPI00340300BF
MAADRSPVSIREFANYLDGLLTRADQGGGWCAVFWQRDPDGMQACLDGRELPPWDVVETLLHDLGAAYGPETAGAERERGRLLHAAAVRASDARPGAREDLGDRLDIMIREQRYAAERRSELNRRLAAAATPQESETLRVDLAWARDDQQRASARCAELRARMEELDRHGPGGRALEIQPIPRGAEGGVARFADLGDPFPAGYSEGLSPTASSDIPESGPLSYGLPATAAHRGPDDAVPLAEPDPPGGHDTRHMAGEAAELADWRRGPDGDSAPEPGAPDGQDARRTPGEGTTEATEATEGPEAEGWRPGPDDASPAEPAVSGVYDVWRTADEEAAEADGWPPGPGGDPYAAQPAAPGGRRGPYDGGSPAQSGAPSGRDARPIPDDASPASPAQPPSHSGAGGTAARVVGGAVGALERLRREGRSGEAHALLVEAAHWPAERLPLLAAELQRAGLGADWATLLWEAASLSADRLVAAAAALDAAGRAADGQQILRQGVVRPAAEIGDAVLGLDDEGQRREVRALLDAYVRMRTPQEAARSVAADPKRLVPLLLEAAQGVSDERRWDLVHALRVAGFTV